MTSPFPTKFVAQATDIILADVSSSREFQLLKGSQLILKESYSYDTDHRIRITGLADTLTQCLFGTLAEGEQLNAKADFTLRLTGEEDQTETLYAQRLLNPRDPQGAKVVLMAAPNGNCYPGVPLLVTVIGEVTVGLTGTTKTTTIGEEDKVVTADCDPAKLFPEDWTAGTALNIGSEALRRILPKPCDDAVVVRFLNRYDMPETLVAAYMQEKPAAQDDVSLMYSQRTRFSVTSSTEYTLKSGPLHHPDEYDTWQDLLLSRRAQIRWQDQWTDIVITKSNYTRQRRRAYGSEVEVSFQTANPLMLL